MSDAKPSTKKPEGAVVPPYVPFTTVIGLLERMVKDGIPNRVDRSYLTGMSGGYQSQVIAALRALGWIDEDTGNPTLDLYQLVEHPDDWPAKLSSQVGWLYAGQVELADQNATQLQLEESFRRDFGLSGSTLRKAIKFFLDIADFVGMQRSPHWSVPKRPSRPSSGLAKSSPKKGRPGTKKPDAPADATGSAAPIGRGSQAVTLKSGGTVVLSMSVDLFSLDESDRQFVFGLIDQMKGYEQRPRPSDQGGEP